MTRRFYATSTTSSNPHSLGGGARAATLTPPGTGSPTQLDFTVSAQANALFFAFYSPSGEPNDADWPAGNNVYIGQLDVVACGADLTYGTNIVTQPGHIGRVNSALSSDLETVGDAQSSTGTGLKAFDGHGSGTWNPSAGSASDRYEAAISIESSTMHGNETWSVNVDTNNTYVQGPWAGYALSGYRARNDDGNETGASWKEAQDTTWTQPMDENFRVRFQIDHLGAPSGLSPSIELYFRVNGGSYNAVSPSSLLTYNGSGSVSDGTATTNQLTGGQGTFFAGTVQTAVAVPPAFIWSGTAVPGGHTEVEACLYANSSDFANDDVIDLQLQDSATGEVIGSVQFTIGTGSGAQTVSNPALLGGATLYAPTVVPDQFVTSPAVLGGAGLLAPSIAQKVVAVLLGGASLFSPQVNQQVDPGLLGGATILAPDNILVAQTVSDPALLGGANLLAPTVIPDQTVSDPALQGGANLLAPTLNQSVLAPALQGGAALLNPQINQSVSVAVTLGGAALLNPQVNQQVASGLQGGATLLAPTVQPGGVSVTLDAVLGGGSLLEPTVSLASGPQTVSDPALLGPAALLAPQVNQQVASSAVLGGATILAPASINQQVVASLLGGATILAPASIDQQVQPGLLGGATIPAPTASVGGGAQTVSDPALQGGATLLAPTINQSVLAPSLQGGAALLAPTVNQQVAVTTVLGGAAVLAPDAIHQQALPGVLGGATLLSPQIDQQVANPALLGGASTLAPSVVQLVAPGLLGGASLLDPVLFQEQIVTDMAVLGGAVLPAPQVLLFNQYVTPDPLGGATLLAPATQGVDVPLLGGAALLDPENITQVVTLNTVLGGATTLAPVGIQHSVQPDLQGGATILTPTAEHTGPQFVAMSLLGGATLLAPTAMGIDMPEPLGGAVLLAPVVLDDMSGFNEQTRQNDPPTRIQKYAG